MTALIFDVPENVEIYCIRCQADYGIKMRAAYKMLPASHYCELHANHAVFQELILGVDMQLQCSGGVEPVPLRMPLPFDVDKFKEWKQEALQRLEDMATAKREALRRRPVAIESSRVRRKGAKDDDNYTYL